MVGAVLIGDTDLEVGVVVNHFDTAISSRIGHARYFLWIFSGDI